MGQTNAKQLIIDQTDIMVSTVITSISLSCTSEIATYQGIHLTCQPTMSTQGHVYEENAACFACFDNVLATQANYYNLQRAQWNSGQAVTISKDINSEYSEWRNQMVNLCGIGTCKSCVFANLSQNNIVNQNQQCAGMTNITDTIGQKLVGVVSQQLSNNQDILSALSHLLSASNSQQVISNVVNRIMTRLTDVVVQGAISQIETTQVISATGKDGSQNSVSFNGASQENVVTSISTFFAKNNIFNTIFQDDEWTQLQQLLSDETTIDKLGNVIVKSAQSLSNLVQSVLGKVIISLVILLAAVILIVLVYGLILLAKKWYTKHKYQSLLRKKLSSGK